MKKLIKKILLESIKSFDEVLSDIAKLHSLKLELGGERVYYVHDNGLGSLWNYVDEFALQPIRDHWVSSGPNELLIIDLMDGTSNCEMCVTGEMPNLAFYVNDNNESFRLDRPHMNPHGYMTLDINPEPMEDLLEYFEDTRVHDILVNRF